jgi:hypothetical protein
VEGDRRDPPIFGQQLPGDWQRRLELSQLVVDGDSDALERPLGRMAAGEARRRGDGGGDGIDELERRRERPAADDLARDPVGVALLAVVAQHARDPPLVPRVQRLGGRERLVGVHPHVERRVVGVGEAALARVDLDGGHPEVQVDHVRAHALVAQHRQTGREVGPHQARPARHLGGELGEGHLGKRVPVDADEQPGRPEALREQPRVAGPTERAVDRDLAGLRIERLDQLAREDRDVLAGHVKQDGQVMR